MEDEDTLVHHHIQRGDMLRGVKFAFILMLLFGLASTVSVQAREKDSRPLCKKPPKNSRIYVGPQFAHLELQIREALPGSTYTDGGQKFNGCLGGLVVAYEYKKFRSLYTALLGGWLTGTISDTGFPSRRINDASGELRFGYNYMALQGEKWVVTPYIGFGFNYNGQKKEGVSPHVKYQYFKYYLPVGLILNYNLRRWITIGFGFEWLPDLDSTLTVSTFPGARFTLKRKNNQYFVEMPFMFRPDKRGRWEIALTPYWKRRKDGQSDLVAALLPLGYPKQTYTYWGGTLTFGYKF